MSDQTSPAAAEAAADLERLDRPSKWRLILGRGAESALAEAGRGAGAIRPTGALGELDAALDVVYQETPDQDGGRGAGLGRSSLRLARWLGDIRKYFTREVVALIQRDAIERRDMKELLFERETLGQVTPSVELAAAILSLQGAIPDETKETARQLVRAVAEEIVRRLATGLERAVRGALDRSKSSPIPRLANLDLRRTLRHNLRNWDAEREALVVDRVFFHARAHRRFEWTVIVCLDQSGSMASSLIYGAVTASILGNLPALRTHLVAFDTEVVDLTDRCADPVDVLFGIQLGGGTDIERAVGYCQGLVTNPRKTLFVLVTDLCEGGDAPRLVARLEHLVQSGVRTVCLLALSDEGIPAFSHDMARRVRNVGVPTFACTPGLLPELLEAALRGDDLTAFERRRPSTAR